MADTTPPEQPPPLLDDDDDIFASPEAKSVDLSKTPDPAKVLSSAGDDDLFGESLAPIENISLDDSLDNNITSNGPPPQLLLNDSGAMGDAPAIVNGESRSTPPLPVESMYDKSPIVVVEDGEPKQIQSIDQYPNLLDDEPEALRPSTEYLFEDISVTPTTPTAPPIMHPAEPSAPSYTPEISSINKPKPAVVQSAPMPAPRREKKEEEHAELEVEHDYKIDISIVEYQKKGEGMKAFVVYRVVVKAHNIPGFSKTDYEVYRRFSDFLGLYDKLVSKHLCNGRFIPVPPEKSVVGMTKTKMSKSEEDSSAGDFLEKRRFSLERYLRRVGQHPALLKDCDFRDFLTLETDLPRSSNTAALSSAGVSKFFGRVGDALNKMAYRMDENDRWFEEKQNEIDELDETLKKLHISVEALVHYRKDLASTTDHFCKGLSMLAACEENTALSRAFSQLAETQEKIGSLHQDQSEKDFYILSEMLKEYISLISTVKHAFFERVKVWQTWQTAQQELTKKREMKTRLELAGKTDKVPAAKLEVQATEQKVQTYEEQFGKITKMIRKEMVRFDAQRIRDFKNMFLQYLESLAETQQQLVKQWETFIPEAKAIIT